MVKSDQSGSEGRLTFGVLGTLIVEDEHGVAAHDDVAALHDACAAANLLELSLHLDLDVFDFVLEFRVRFEWVCAELDDLLVGVSPNLLLHNESARTHDFLRFFAVRRVFAYLHQLDIVLNVSEWREEASVWLVLYLAIIYNAIANYQIRLSGNHHRW